MNSWKGSPDLALLKSVPSWSEPPELGRAWRRGNWTGRLLAGRHQQRGLPDNGNIRGLRLSPPSRKSLYGLPTASTEQPHRQQHHDSQAATNIPFCKHKDQSLRCIFETDRQYLVWCLSQSWFRTKFETLFDIIVEDVSSCWCTDGCKNNI
jgi:hypothetical protein